MSIEVAPTSPALAMYGDGSSGNVVFDGVSTVLGLAPSSSAYTLTADINVNNMTVNSGVAINTRGFVIRVAGLLTNRGSINGNGISSTSTTAGGGIATTGTLQTASAAGGNGRNTTGNGSNASGSGGRNVTGAAGSRGGDADGGNVGGTGNNTAAPTAIQGTVRNLTAILRGRLMDGQSMNGSGGGGGGGCNVGTGTASSGGGGGSAICQIIFARRLDNAGGTISVNGGNGADASVTGDGKAGGGGGGAGGFQAIVTEQIVAQGTIQALGGTGGLGAGGGTNGTNGGNGFSLLFSQNAVSIL